jgi:short-subunit dehydrogenase
MNRNKVALITGASGGIGKAIARYFSQKNYDLVLLARNEQKLKELKRELSLENSDINIICFKVDLLNPSEVKKATKNLFNTVSRVDVLFNGAGIAIGGTSHLSVDDFAEQMQTNVIATFAFVKAAALHMKQQQYGYIFNMASIVGKKALAVNGGYCASKFAVVGLSQALFYEMLPYGVKVTALCPGAIDTAMTNKLELPNVDKIQTKDIVQTIDYLLSLSQSAAVDSIDIRCVKRPL